MAVICELILSPVSQAGLNLRNRFSPLEANNLYFVVNTRTTNVQQPLKLNTWLCHTGSNTSLLSVGKMMKCDNGNVIILSPTTCTECQY